MPVHLSNKVRKSDFMQSNNLCGPNSTYLCVGFRAYMVWSYMALSFFSPIQLRMLIGNSWNRMWTKRVLYFMSTGRPLSETWRMTQAPRRVLIYTCRMRARDRHQHPWIILNQCLISKEDNQTRLPNLLCNSAALHSDVTSWVTDADDHHSFPVHVFRPLVIPAVEVFPFKCLYSCNAAELYFHILCYSCAKSKKLKNHEIPQCCYCLSVECKNLPHFNATLGKMYVKRVFTWEVFERQVRVGVVTGAADNCIKDVPLLLSIFILSHHFPLTRTRKVRSLFDTLHWGLKCKNDEWQARL